MLVRYIFITLLGVVIVAAVVLATLYETPTVGVVGSLIPTATAIWLLRQLRSLQDERMWYMMRLRKFEPRIITCTDLHCLQDVAEQVYHELDRLDTPVTTDLTVAPRGGKDGSPSGMADPPATAP